jgi:hypothetical protein
MLVFAWPSSARSEIDWHLNVGLNAADRTTERIVRISFVLNADVCVVDIPFPKLQNGQASNATVTFTGADSNNAWSAVRGSPPTPAEQ